MDRPENELNALEARLAAWRPAPSALDRDRMLFLAGRASARSEMRGRIASAAVVGLALVAVGLGGMLVSERARRARLEVVIAERTRQPEPVRIELIVTPSTPARDSYMALTPRALSLGGDLRPIPTPHPPSSDGSFDRDPPLSPLSTRRADALEF